VEFQEDNKIYMKKIFLFNIILFTANVTLAQNEPYSGGIGSGYKSNQSALTTCPMYFGGNADGSANNLSAITICPSYFGGTGDGYSTNSSGCITILPIKLLSFTGEKETQRNILHRKIEQGDLVQQFEIEKSSDGNSFTKIATVQGSTDINFKYLFIDNNPFQKVTYYRLFITERTGAVLYSKIIFIKDPSTSILYVYPNPNIGQATLYYYSPKTYSTNLELYQLDGKIVLKKSISVINGENKFPLNLERLSGGNYVLIIRDNDTHEKIIIRKN
jgi:Secretion system C-terminal sorting domain